MCRCLGALVLLIAVGIGTLLWYIKLPGPNGLSFSTTAEDAVRPGVHLDGKNVIITGGHSGIGIPTVEVLAKLKASIWMLARPEGMKRCEEVALAIRTNSNNQFVNCEEMDLGSLRSVKTFAEKWKKKNLPLHILINNAGVGIGQYYETEDGFEYIWEVNHLGHFLLTNLLLDNLRQGTPSRVVVVSSNLQTGIFWDDISGKNTWYNGTGILAQFFGSALAYGQSKTANILFAIKLNEIMKDFGNANSLHPGLIATELNRRASPGSWEVQFLRMAFYLIGKTPSQGAATQLYVATAPELLGIGGKYFVNCNVARAFPFSTDPKSADILWKMSEEMVADFLKK